MNYYPFHIGEPFQSELKIAMKQRDESKTSKERSKANAEIRSIRLKAARSGRTGYGFEIKKDFYKSACAWLEREQQQTSLFSQPARQGFQPSLLEAA